MYKTSICLIMGKKANWTPQEDNFLRSNLKEGASLKDIASSLNKTEDAVYLYCYRHNIPLRPRLQRPLMRKLLGIKFGIPEYFHPGKDFFARVGINQKRWSELAWGYVQPTQDELLRVAKELNFTVEEAFELMEARQLDLFE